jgi:hypothetical protein
MAPRTKLLLGFVLASALPGCYLPTANRLCRDLRLSSENCKDHASLRDTFISNFPVGTRAQELRDSLDRTFIQQDSLTRLHEKGEILELVANFDVAGMAACKEDIIVSFRLADGAVADISVTGGQVCL